MKVVLAVISQILTAAIKVHGAIFLAHGVIFLAHGAIFLAHGAIFQAHGAIPKTHGSKLCALTGATSMFIDILKVGSRRLRNLRLIGLNTRRDYDE